MVATGPMPGSTPISVPSSDADERVEQVDRRQRDAEAQGEMAEQIHARVAQRAPGQIGELQLEPDHEHADGERRQQDPADDRLLRPEFVARGAGHDDQQDRRQHEADA